MTAKELITQYADTGIQLPEYQVNKLSNQDKKTYIRKRLLTKQVLDIYEFKLIPEEFFVKLSSTDVIDFMHRQRKHIDNLVSSDIFIDNFKLSLDNLTLFMYYSVSSNGGSEGLIKRLLSSDKFISKLNSETMEYLLFMSKNREAVINRLLSSDEFISKLDSESLNELIRYTNDKVALKNKLIKIGVPKDLINAKFW